MKVLPEHFRNDPKSFVRRFTVLLLSVLLTLAARQSRAEMWCGDGPGTALSHPCADGDDDNPAVEDAIAKYRDRWMRLKGVWSVEQGDDQYHNRVADIEVHVESTTVAAVRKQIPSSVDRIPIVIVPGEIPTGLDSFVGLPVSNRLPQSDRRSSDATEGASLVSQDEDRKKDEDLYVSVVQKYGYHWMDLPGVTRIEPAKCDRNGCDFKTVEVSVQRQLLPEARKEIPASINGERIVLTPED